MRQELIKIKNKKEVLKKSLILILIFPFWFAGLAQSDFRKAFIIDNNNDTLFGYIDYKNDYQNCNKCVFKTDLEKETTTYLPGDIKYYRFNEDKFFISTYLNDLEKNVFLEFLIDGIVDIYYYKDFNKEYYYVKKENSELFRLNADKKTVTTDEVYVRTISGWTKTTTDFNMSSYEHIGILRYLFSDDKETLEKVDNVGLNHKSLINIANKYHQNVCKDQECVVFEKQMPPFSFNFDILCYADFSTISISNSNDYDGFNYENNLNYALGLGVSIRPSRFYERLSIYLQVLYSQKEYSADYTEPGLAGRFNYYTSDIKFDYLSNKLGLKYTFPTKNIQPELFINYTFCYTLNSSAIRVKEEETNIVTNIYNYNDEIVSSNYNGISIGAGLPFLKMNKFQLVANIQYEYVSNNLSGTASKPQVNLSALRIGMGIRF